MPYIVLSNVVVAREITKARKREDTCPLIHGPIPQELNADCEAVSFAGRRARRRWWMRRTEAFAPNEPWMWL